MSVSLHTQTGLHHLTIQVLNIRVCFLNIIYASLTSIHGNLEHGLAILTESFSIGGSKGVPGMCTPLGSKFFHFHAVFGKKNCKIIPIWELAHPLGKILDLPLFSPLKSELPVADLGGTLACTPYGPKCSQFHTVFRKIWQNHMLAPPPMGNPGSTLAVADLGRHPQHTPPMAQNFLYFMQFFGKFNKIVCWCPPRGSVSPPTGNPGSTPLLKSKSEVLQQAMLFPFCHAH